MNDQIEEQYCESDQEYPVDTPSAEITDAYREAYKRVGAYMVFNGWTVNCLGPNGERLIVMFCHPKPESLEELTAAGFIVSAHDDKGQSFKPGSEQAVAMRRHVCDRLGAPYTSCPVAEEMAAEEATESAMSRG